MIQRFFLLAPIFFAFLNLTNCKNTADETVTLLSRGKSAQASEDYAQALEIFLPLAVKGNAEAQFQTGLLYYKGHGLEQNLESAQRWFEKAAAQEHVASIYYSGLIYARQDFSANDIKKSQLLIIKAAEKGSPEAQFQMGRIFEGRTRVGKNFHKWENQENIDLEKAYEWYDKAARQGHLKANLKTARLILSNKVAEKDSAKALKILQDLAEQGQRLAQYELGLAFMNGNAGKVDLDNAKNYLLQASKQGLSKAMVALAELIDKIPEPTEEDKIDSFKWIEKAAENGDSEALYQLGIKLTLGLGTKIDINRALSSFTEATNKGSSKAKDLIKTETPKEVETNKMPALSPEENKIKDYEEGVAKSDANAIALLARAYETGIGVTKNIKKSLELYNQAISLGNIDSMLAVAIIYQQGREVEKNISQSSKLFQKAALAGSAAAQNKLGLMYDLGSGVEKNGEEAIKWYTKSAEQNYAPAQYNLASLLLSKDNPHKNVTEAIAWLEKAAAQNYFKAQTRLASIYLDGNDITRDEKKAFDILLKATSSGNRKIIKTVSRMYASGQGTEKNLHEAARYALLAHRLRLEKEENDDLKKDNNGGNKITLIKKDLDTNLTNLTESMRMIPFYENGKMIGFKIVGLKEESVWSKMGLKKGDILKSINEKPIDISDKKSFFQTVENKFYGEDSLSYTVERNGQNEKINITLR